MTVTWQGVPVTGPLLIFHSEIQQTVNSNSLTCSHPTGPVAWYLTTGIRLTTRDSGTVINVITDRINDNGGRQAQIRRGDTDRQESEFDGLWTCRLNGVADAGAFHVGIYDDTPPTGKITPFPGLLPTTKSSILEFSGFLISLLLPIIYNHCRLVHSYHLNMLVTDIQHNHLHVIPPLNFLVLLHRT